MLLHTSFAANEPCSHVKCVVMTSHTAALHIDGNVQCRRGGQLIREHVVDLHEHHTGGRRGRRIQHVTWNCKLGMTLKETDPANCGETAVR